MRTSILPVLLSRTIVKTTSSHIISTSPNACAYAHIVSLSLHLLEIHLSPTRFLPSQRHGARLDHKSHDLVEDVGGSHLGKSDLSAQEVKLSRECV